MKGKLPRILAVSLTAGLLGACQPAQLATPACRAQQQDIPAEGQHYCIIAIANRLLVLNHQLSAGLSLPGGAAQGDSGQCNAHQAVWQQSGFNVEVGRTLLQQGDAHFYHCTLDAGFTGEIVEFRPPQWADDSIDSLRLVDPFELTHKALYQPDELVLWRDLFIQAQQSP